MITKICVENIQIEDWYVNKIIDLDFKRGLNILDTNVGKFVEDFINYIQVKFYMHMDNKAFHIKTINEKNPGYIILHCAYKDDIIKYTSFYDGEKLYSELLTLGDSLIANIDYYTEEPTINTGILYGDTLGKLFYTRKDTKLLCGTEAGLTLLSSFDYIICNFSELDYGMIGNTRLELNKLLPIFGFDVKIDYDLKITRTVGLNNYKLPISLEGNGFLHILEILTKIIYCRESKKSLLIPNYKEFLHPLLSRNLTEYLSICGVNIIATDYLG